MENNTQSSILPAPDRLDRFSVVNISLDRETTETLEAVAQANGQTVSELAESILMVYVALTQDKDQDGLACGGENEIGDEWEKLTNELLRLESIRPGVVQLAGDQRKFRNTADPLLSLLEVHDQKIRECEDKLENLTARRRNQSAFCGLIADYYDR